MSLNLNCHSRNNMQENIQNVTSFCKDVHVHISSNTLRLNNAILDPEHLFKRLRMMWVQLEEIVLEDKLPPNFEAIRENNEILMELKSCLSACGDFVSDSTKNVLQTQLKLLRRSIIRFSEMDNLQLCKLNGNALKKESSGVYHYFHTFLNLQWYLIILDYCLCGYSIDVNNQITQLIKDLTALSHLQYNKFGVQQPESHPFLCSCVKTIWICLQLFLEKQSNQAFWTIFNQVLSETDPAFSLWLLYHINMLQGYDETGTFVGVTCKRVTPNQDFAEKQLEKLLSSDSNRTAIFKYCLINVEPLINTWWCSSVKVTIFQMLWEHFYKTLNCPPEADTPPTNALTILTTIESLRADPCSAKTAFQIFVGMLARYLSDNRSQWSKLKGRIYIRLPVKKCTSLSDSAFYNVYLLFTALAPVDFEEITGRICGMLVNLSQERQYNTFTWNLYCALIILYLQNERPIHALGKNMNSLLQESVKSRDSYDLIRHFINNLEDIMQASSTYSLGQCFFLDSWIKKYLQNCHVTDAEELLKILIKIVDNVHKSDVWTEWDPVFQIHVFPCLKQLAIAANASPQIGQLAAALCKVSPELSTQAVTYFTDDPVDPGVSAKFVLTLLDNQFIPNQEGCIIRAWLRCCLLSTENNQELTKSVLRFHSAFLPFKDKLDTSTNPLYDILEALAKETNNFVRDNVLKLLLDSLTNMDVWVKSCIKEPKSETVTIHIYTCTAVLVYNFSALLYNRTKSACLLSRLISTLLLPAEILMGRTPHSYILHSVQRTWHLYFNGIYSLNWNDDGFLERTLKDLIVCYIPHFPPDNTSPLLKCFGNDALAIMIMQKTAHTFLGHSPKCNKQHSLKVLRFFDNLINSCKSMVIIRFIAQDVLIVLLEFILFNLHCNAAVSVLISLASLDIYDLIKPDVHKSIMTVTEKHLTFNSNNYFQLAQILVKVVPADMKALLPNIQQTIVSVEKIRGDGFDSTLRKGLAGIEATLATMSV